MSIDRRNLEKTIAIDFDGTICDFNFPQCGDLKPRAKETIDKLKEEYIIVISSCRTSKVFQGTPAYKKFIDDMVDFLDKHNIYYDKIDMGDEGKIVAGFYIDDRAITFTDWKSVLDQIEKLSEQKCFVDINDNTGYKNKGRG